MRLWTGEALLPACVTLEVDGEPSNLAEMGFPYTPRDPGMKLDCMRHQEH